MANFTAVPLNTVPPPAFIQERLDFDEIIDTLNATNAIKVTADSTVTIRRIFGLLRGASKRKGVPIKFWMDVSRQFVWVTLKQAA